jgi:hypothetical protein
MEWHPFYYKGEETNIEVNKLGEVRRVRKEWVKINRKKPFTIPKLVIYRGYQRVWFSVKNIGVKCMEFHKVMAIVFLNHTPCGYRLVIDHIDGNSLNNNIKNLREVTHRINMINRKNKSKYGTGVKYECGKYRVKIGINGKYLELGRYDTPEEASEVYHQKLRQIEAGVFI